MTYGTTTLATDFTIESWQIRLLRVLFFFIPKANPDNEKLYRFVKKWYLELDDSGIPVREIGVDSNGNPLFGAPDNRNVGFWTDSAEVFQKDRVCPIRAQEFEALWSEAQKKKLRPND